LGEHAATTAFVTVVSGGGVLRLHPAGASTSTSAARAIRDAKGLFTFARILGLGLPFTWQRDLHTLFAYRASP